MRRDPATAGLPNAEDQADHRHDRQNMDIAEQPKAANVMDEKAGASRGGHQSDPNPAKQHMAASALRPQHLHRAQNQRSQYQRSGG